MPALRVSIVGGTDPRRTYEPPVDYDLAREAARALGAELARRGHGLVVYDPRFTEGEVVAGYVAAAGPGLERTILVRQPHLQTPVLFPEERTSGKLFRRQADTSEQWEVSFYRSLADADAVVLLGGASSTLNAGQIAIGARIPLLALERTGGSASVVWKTVSPGVDLPTSDEHARMGHAPSEETVRGWVDDLEAQRRRRYAVETGPIRRHAVIASLLFVAALVLALGSHLFPLPPHLDLALLVGAMLLAGGAGAAVRMVFERRYGSGPLVPPSLAVTLALGMMSGAVAGLLYLVAQPGDVNLEAGSAIRLVSTVAVVSVVGGLTAESVFRKLLGIDVVRGRDLAASEPPAPRSSRPDA